MKAQVSLEYLFTYGWALIVLFFVLAFLFTSDFFSFSSYSPQECAFQSSFPCPSFIIYKSSSSTFLKFYLVNGLGFPINITNVSYQTINLGQKGKSQKIGPLPNPTFLLPGQRANFSVEFDGPTQPQERDYRSIIVSCSGPYTSVGRISGIIEKT